jgi:YceI-like domain.
MRSSTLLVACSIGIAACASFVPPDTSATVDAGAAPDVVWFTGASNIRHFVCGSKTVNVLATAAPEEFERTKADGIPAVSGAALTVPVTSIDCGINKMNRDLNETIGGDRNPTINFRLWNYVVLKRAVPGSVRMNGLLRLAGKERMMVVYGNVARDNKGQLRLRGERVIDVREFGIKPPKRFFGLFHVGHDITVHFDVAVRPLMDPNGILVKASAEPNASE